MADLSMEQHMIKTIIQQKCHAILEFMYSISSTDSHEKGDCCVCRIVNPAKLGLDSFRIIVRLHDVVEEENQTHIRAFSTQSSRQTAGADRKTQLWDFLDELCLPYQDLLQDKELDVLQRDLEDDGFRLSDEQIEYLDLNEGSILNELRSLEQNLPGRKIYFAHPNILSPFAFFRTQHEGMDYWLSMYPYVDHNLCCALKYSTQSFFRGYTKKFILLQLLKLMKFCHYHDVQFGNLCASKFLMSDEAWVYALVDFRRFNSTAKEVKMNTEQNQSKESANIGTKASNVSKNIAVPGIEDYRTCSAKATAKLYEALSAWQHGAISNLEYLLLLNLASGRERGNLRFYPIIPWVIDMSSKPEEDNDSTWRDLRKTKWRLAKGDEQLDMTYISSDPAHHLTDEALSELTVCVYLARRLRKEVLTTVVRASFEAREYPSSVKRVYEWTPDEAIPDFYDNPGIFSSIHSEMADMEVPDWALSPSAFIQAHRAALESPRVSNLLHHWIDLTFGYLLTGEKAVQEKNVHLPQRDLCFPQSTGRFQIFSKGHPVRFPSPSKVLMMNNVAEKEKICSFAVEELWFCLQNQNNSAKRHQENIQDILFVNKLSNALHCRKNQNLLYADVQYVDINIIQKCHSQDVFANAFQKHLLRVLSAYDISSKYAVADVLCNPYFDTNLLNLYNLISSIVHPSMQWLPKLDSILHSLKGRLESITDKSLYLTIFRVFIGILFPKVRTYSSALDSESVSNIILSIFGLLLSKLCKEDTEKYLLPLILNHIHGKQTEKNIVSVVGLDMSHLFLQPRFILNIFKYLGEDVFLNKVFPRMLEHLVHKSDDRSKGLITQVVISVAHKLPMPIIIRKMLEPLLVFLYNYKVIEDVILALSRSLEKDFVKLHLFPRLLLLIKWPILNSRRSSGSHQKSNGHLSDMMVAALRLLQETIQDIDANESLEMLVEDSTHNGIQQPSILFQMLLMPFPNLAVLINSSKLLVMAAKHGGGLTYITNTLLPNLEPIFYINDDGSEFNDDYMIAIGFLYHLLCKELGEKSVRDIIVTWKTIEDIHLPESILNIPLTSFPSKYLNSIDQNIPTRRSRSSNEHSYTWLKRDVSPDTVSTPDKAAGMRVAPSSYMSSQENLFNFKFKAVYQLKTQLSRLKCMSTDENKGLIVASGLANTNSSNSVVKVWDIGNQNLVNTYVSSNSIITGLYLCPKESVAAICDNMGRLHIWNPATEEYIVFQVTPAFEFLKYYTGKTSAKDNIQVGPSHSGNQFGCSCMTSDKQGRNDNVIMGTTEGYVPIFDIRVQKPTALWQAWNVNDTVNSWSIEAIALNSHNEMCVAFGSGNSSVIDIRCGKPTCYSYMHDGPVTAVSYYSSHLLVSGGSDKKLRMWDTRKVSTSLNSNAHKSALLHMVPGFRDEISGVLPVGEKMIVNAGARMNVFNMKSAYPFQEDSFKVRNLQGAKETSSISELALHSLSGLLALSNEEGNIFLLE